MAARNSESEPDAFGAFVERVAEGDVRAAPNTSHDGVRLDEARLHGVRLAVKDNIAVEGLKWTAGLPLLAQRRAVQDAGVVQTLRRAGARIVGVTATDAAGFGMTTPGVVNPSWPLLTAGGSSGGSAAAVAAGLADVGLGTDTGGSVRVPAACCGLLGLKLSYEAALLDGVTPLSPSLDHAGLIAADIDVLMAAVRAISGQRVPAANELPRTIGYDPRRLAGVAPGVAAIVRCEIERLERSGLEVVAIELPEREALTGAHGVLACVEARQVWARQWPGQAALFGDTAARTLAYAAEIDAGTEEWARVTIAAAKAAIDAVLAAVDVVIGPVMMCEVPRAGARKVTIAGEAVPVLRALVSETCPFNVSGHPAISVPVANRGKDRPGSIQIVGQKAADVALLEFVKRRLLS